MIGSLLQCVQRLSFLFSGKGGWGDHMTSTRHNTLDIKMRFLLPFSSLPPGVCLLGVRDVSDLDLLYSKRDCKLAAGILL